MRRLPVTLMLVVATGCLVGPGCEPAYRDPVSGVEAQYEWETLRAELNQEISTVYPAARGAAHELDLRVQRAALNGIAAEVIALDAHMETVYIRLEALPESRSLLTIRVGTFGNKNKSIVLFERIMENLVQRGESSTRDPAFNDDP